MINSATAHPAFLTLAALSYFFLQTIQFDLYLVVLIKRPILLIEYRACTISIIHYHVHIEHKYMHMNMYYTIQVLIEPSYNFDTINIQES